MKKQFYLKLFLIVVFIFNGTLFAQNVAGIVSDSNEPLPGVTVVIKGTTKGTTTDINGKYTISNISEENAVLVFSFVGMKTQEVQVDGRLSIDIIMQQDLADIDEVIVVGYTAQKKSTITGAVATVEMDDIEQTRVPNVSQALQGQLAGVQVASSSGAPGEPVQIRIRGEGTIGNNNPLYIVDGIPTRDIAFLNPADIKSMTVLKDAASSAIYGSRASAGVIVITTKKGKAGKLNLDVNYYTGFNKPSNLPELLNGEQYMNTVEKAWDNTYGASGGTNPYTQEKQTRDLDDVDYLDELFDTGRSNNFQLSASGGNEKTQFLMSLSYYGENGPVVGDKDKLERFTFRTNINANITNRLTVGSNLQLTHSTQDKIRSYGESLMRFAFIRPPVLSVYKDVNDPTYSESNPFTDLPFYYSPGYDLGWAKSMYEIAANPMAQLHFTDNVRKAYKTLGNVYGEYSFLPDNALKFRTNLGVELTYFHNKSFGENFGDDDGGGSAIDRGLGRNNRPNGLSESRGEDFTITWNNTLSYNKTFAEKHHVDFLVGTEYIDNFASAIGGSRKRYTVATPEFRYLDYGASDLDVWNNGSASEWALFSYFGSASYAFDGKYLLNSTFRADASSRFSSKNQWGYFPSVSGGWIMSKESFLEDVDWLSNLKLRASWGKLGNQEIDNYAFLTLVSQTDGKVVINRYGNEDLKWETSTQSNIGADISVLNNKIGVSVEYFNIYTTDILLPIGLPGVVGDVSPTILNAGEVSNKGFEFSINYRNYDNEFKYNIDANLATLNNNVEALHPNLPYISNGVTRTQPGQPLNAYFGYKMDGIYQNQQEIDTHLSGTANPSVRPGDIKFEDISGDGKINSDDRDFIGSPIPKLTYGASFSAEYKGFDVFMLFQGVDGVDRYNDGKKILDWDSRPFNYTTAILDAWDGEGSSNTIPRVALDDNGSSKFSSVFVEDASYFRFKNIELGYNLRSLEKIDNIRFYISAQNIFTITNYTGLDPESVQLTDKGTQPQSKTLMLGINISL